MSSMEDFERGFGNYSGGGMIKAALEEGDLEEDGVWSVMKTTEGSKSDSKSKTRKKVSPASAWRSAVAISSREGGQAQVEDSDAEFVAQHSSAPIDIPDWSKILKMKCRENLWDDDDACDYPNDNDSDDGGSKTHRVKNDDDDDGDEMVPPHEYLARKLSSTQMASFSMCEGVGRTLKGRDLSKTRNAVLTKTGFLE